MQTRRRPRKGNTTARPARLRALIATLTVVGLTVLSIPAALAGSSEYDPATDPGSLHNVARRIRLDDKKVKHYTGEGVQIALIDTGVVDVPGLRHSNVVVGPDFSFEDASEDLRGRDTNGHGTHLAGIMVATDEAWAGGDNKRKPERVLGVAPDAGLVSIKVAAADGGVDVSQVIAAINWVVDHHDTDGYDIRVINLAFGTDGIQDYQVDPLAYAVERAWHAGIVVVVAAGNDGQDAGRLRNPARDPYVIAVGAAETYKKNTLTLASFTNGGSEQRRVDIIAPGRSIVSLRNPGSFSDDYNQAGRVGDALVRASGSSQATAVVSAAVAVLLQQRPELTPDQVKKILIDSATKESKEEKKEDSGAPGALDIKQAIKTKTPHYQQTWPRATGTGSLEAARGSTRVELDGVVLEGEIDIFGNSWTGSSWTGNSWTGNSWTGSSWL